MYLTSRNEHECFGSPWKNAVLDLEFPPKKHICSEIGLDFWKVIK